VPIHLKPMIAKMRFFLFSIFLTTWC